MSITGDPFEAMRAAAAQLWAESVADRCPSHVAVLMALAGFQSCPGDVGEVELTEERRLILLDWLSESRVPREALVPKANALLPDVARLLGVGRPRPVTPNHFGVVLHRLRERLSVLVRRGLGWDQSRSPQAARKELAAALTAVFCRAAEAISAEGGSPGMSVTNSSSSPRAGDVDPRRLRELVSAAPYRAALEDYVAGRDPGTVIGWVAHMMRAAVSSVGASAEDRAGAGADGPRRRPDSEREGGHEGGLL